MVSISTRYASPFYLVTWVAGRLEVDEAAFAWQNWTQANELFKAVLLTKPAEEWTEIAQTDKRFWTDAAFWLCIDASCFGRRPEVG